MCLLRGILLPILLVVVIVPVVLLWGLVGSGLSSLFGRKKSEEPDVKWSPGTSSRTYEYDVRQDDHIDPAKIEYIDYEEVEKEEPDERKPE